MSAAWNEDDAGRRERGGAGTEAEDRNVKGVKRREGEREREVGGQKDR